MKLISYNNVFFFKRLFSVVLRCSILLLPVYSFASISPELVLMNRKYITATLPADTYAKPTIFPTTNNLRRKTGSPFLAKGEPLIIKGRITDLMDVPIDDVVVKIWHTNHFGYYNYLVSPDDTDEYDVDFLSAGKCRTDNLGYYNFITIMPGYYGNRAPHIHFLIEHPDFGIIETEMLFPEHYRLSVDTKIKNLKKAELETLFCSIEPADPNDPSAGKIATFNIKLDGFHKTKKY